MAAGRILVVDDDPSIISLLNGILRTQYAVMAVTTGARCLQVAASQQPSLILLDVSLPDINGCEVCRQLKQAVSCQQIPVILMSANDRAEDVASGSAAGACDYIIKPLDAASVLSTVARWLFHPDDSMREG